MATKLTLFLISAASAAPVSAQLSVGPFYGGSAQARLGTVVERIGDVDGDGTRDFAIGAPFADETIDLGFPLFVEDAGSVAIYSGVDGQLIWKAAGSIGGSTEFGAAVADAGDVDLDGHDDVLVGAPEANGFSPASGAVKLLSGADGSVLNTYFGSQTGERYGAALCAGDLDSDTANEGVIGAPHHDADGSSAGFLQEGRIEIVDLASGVLKVELVGHPIQVQTEVGLDEYVRRGFGAQLEYLGDLDSDGYGSLLMAAPLSDHIEAGFWFPTTKTTAGVVQILEPLHPMSSLFSGSFYPGEEGELLGLRMEAFDDDLNGDGNVDWALYGAGTSSVRVYSSPLAPMFTIDGDCVEGTESLASVGDVDQDGIPDLAVGVPGLGSSMGRVCILSGFDGTPIKTLTGQQTAGQFGSAVAGADMDGDGTAEIWIGAPSDDSAHANAGAVYVRSESDCHILATWAHYGSGVAGTFGVPTLFLSSAPVQGSNIGVNIGSVTDFQTVALLVIGVQKLELPILGGTLLVNPIAISGHVLAIGGGWIGFKVPDAPQHCGLHVYMQALQQNPHAPEGWAFSPGVDMKLGG